MTAVEPIKVAVIGGGAAGMAAARVLSRHGMQPIVFEKEVVGGGVWRYLPNSRTSPMYQGLRTNLPREIMAFREKPWEGPGNSYVTHDQVLEYLQAYKNDFDLDQYINYGSKVTQLTMLPRTTSRISTETEKWPKIQLEWETVNDHKTADFDAVCVANGHYALPSVPHLPGREHFQGKIIHSIEYDEPSVFQNQTVVCIGGRASGSDLAREISQFATKVYLSDTTMESIQVVGNVTWVPRTVFVNPGGTLQFDHDCQLKPTVDVIIFCTGYDYHLPFVNGQSNIDLENVPGERRISPLFEQLWHARYPNLSFHGLPHSIIPFPLFELQAEAVTGQFLGRFQLPPCDQRLQEAARDAIQGGSKNTGRVQDTHYLGSAQWEYCRTLAKYAGLLDEGMEHYIATNEAIWDHSGRERKGLVPGSPDIYRQTNYIRRESDFDVVGSCIETGSTTLKWTYPSLN